MSLFRIPKDKCTLLTFNGCALLSVWSLVRDFLFAVVWCGKKAVYGTGKRGAGKFCLWRGKIFFPERERKSFGASFQQNTNRTSPIFGSRMR
ncbi:hypothetical protein HQ50_06785 [Porphyromonas sp. COT-052 OH4946]|nr:hypothetical protein HQ50_06785 [Porphyromonas sp. COT-052 OH4946]